MKDRILLLLVATVAALLAFVIFHYLGLYAFLGLIAIINLLSMFDNHKLRKKLNDLGHPEGLRYKVEAKHNQDAALNTRDDN